MLEAYTSALLTLEEKDVPWVQALSHIGVVDVCDDENSVAMVKSGSEEAVEASNSNSSSRGATTKMGGAPPSRKSSRGGGRGGGSSSASSSASLARKRKKNARKLRFPIEIVPSKLYMSGANTTKNLGQLHLLGITHILNMGGPEAAKYHTPEDYKREGFYHKMVDADDVPTFPILERHWNECRVFLDQALGSGGRCLVHCSAGINRSGVIVAAYYMISTKSTVLETVRHCRERRRVFLNNVGFLQQLVTLARQEGLLGSLSEAEEEAKVEQEGRVAPTKSLPQPSCSSPLLLQHRHCQDNMKALQETMTC